MEKYDKKAAEQIERSYQTPEIVNQRLRTLAALALCPGEAVLDAGCGTGLLLEQQALTVGREGRAEGIDFSDDMLAHARRRCDGLEQANLQQGSIETLPFGDAVFDAASCTQTLLYVENLDSALQELHRVLKSRGRIAVVETDWSGAIINSQDAAMTHSILESWSAAVVNPHLPCKLGPLLRAVGFSAVRVEAIPVLNATCSEHGFSTTMLANFAGTAQRLNVISADESNAWLAGIEELKRRGEYFFCVNRFLFSAIK